MNRNKRWPSSQNKASKEDVKDMKLVSRAAMLSNCQNYSLVGILVGLMAIALLVSSFSVDMLVYDEGNVYSCPVDAIEDTLAREYEYEQGDDEGKAWQLDPISHT